MKSLLNISFILSYCYLVFSMLIDGLKIQNIPRGDLIDMLILTLILRCYIEWSYEECANCKKKFEANDDR